MNLDRWMISTRMTRAAADDAGAASTTAAATGGDASAAASSSAPPAADAAPSSSAAPAPSPLAAADASKRDGAPAPAADAAPAKPDLETPAKAGEAPPPGGTEGKDAAKPEGDAAAKKPDAAAGDKKPGETAEAKPDGADAAADKKPGEAEAPPAPPPAYEPYKVPETLKLDETRLAEFNTILGEAELTGKADHAAMQQLGQKIMDLYAGEVQRIGEQVQQYQVDVWNRHLESELNVLKSDPQLGGNRIDTTLGNAKYVLEQFGGSKDEQDRFMAVLDRAGVSSNRDFVAMLNRMHERYREPEPVPPNLPSVKPNNRGSGSKGWYDTVDVGGAKA